jgi:hypothetical protein
VWQHLVELASEWPGLYSLMIPATSTSTGPASSIRSLEAVRGWRYNLSE